MLRSFYIFGIVALLALATLTMAARVSSPIAPRASLPLMTGEEDLSNVPVTARPAPHQHLDLIGEVYQAGTTWYDYQHNGTAGKMIGVDGDGYIHVVWMNGLSSTQNPRHVYYNVWDPTSDAFAIANGSQVNASTRAGYACQTVYGSGPYNGFCFPTFHEILSGANAHTASAIDFLPRSGAFTTSQPAWCYEGGVEKQYIWPKVAYTQDGKLHVVSTLTTPTAGETQAMMYSRGTPEFDADGFGLDITWDPVGGSCDYLFIDSCMTIAGDVAASIHSNRVVIAWAHNRDVGDRTQINNDLYIQVSEDGGENWGAPQNVTDFVPGDPSCPSGDTLACNNDTLRLYTDCNVIIDNNDYIHVAFTVRTWYDVGYPGYGAGPLGWIDQSGIFHWGEEFNEFSPVANAYYFQTIEGGTLIDNGAWQLNKHRPNLAEDTTNGLLYCSYQMYDSTQYSDQGYPMGDAYVSVSATCGRAWSQAVNVTQTDGGQNTPPPGSLSERDITLAKYVTAGSDGNRYLHMEYVMDHDAGGIPQTEGTATLNEVYYQRIPVDSIPLTPLLNPFWPAMRVDSTGFPGREIALDTSYTGGCLGTSADDRPSLRPESFALYQNYPNPFNPSTKIAFDLVRDARVTLKVFNVMGQEVATLMDHKSLTMGAQNVSFDASSLASGVYVYRLTVDGVTAAKKMVLMK